MLDIVPHEHDSDVQEHYNQKCTAFPTTTHHWYDVYDGQDSLHQSQPLQRYAYWRHWCHYSPLGVARYLRNNV